MDEVRSWYEVPAISHFFHIFKDSFDLIEFEIEDFEEALFLDSAENVSSFIPDLVIGLLRGLYKTKDGLQVTMDNYNSYLQDLLAFRYVTLAEKENPIGLKSFKTLSTKEKVKIIYDMCNWRLELEDAMELTKNLEADSMRIEPVGRDGGGDLYWFFYGTRLYKETPLYQKSACVLEDIVEEDAPKKQQQNPKKRKRKKNAFPKKTKSGRAVKKRKLDYTSQESHSESEDDEEAPGTEQNDAKEINGSTKQENPWCLVCSTYSEWEELTKTFKGSKNKDEKALHKELVGYLNYLPEIFTQKEKALQKKLLAMVPRRASDRIQWKAQQREHEQRLVEQERLHKSQEKAREAEERQKELAKEKEKERERRYLERERNLELRALRAKQREEMKLVAENPELAKELQINKENSYSKIKMEDEDDDKYYAMERVLDALKVHDDAWPFLEPVDESEAPNYYTFIQNPMDLKTIEAKIKDKTYDDKQELEDDVILMIDNCETYNGTQSPFTKLAFKLKRVFHRVMKREFPPEADNSDDVYDEAKEDVMNSKPKVKKLKTEKSEKQPTTPKPKAPKMKKEPHRPSIARGEKATSLKTLRMFNSLITPEFARNQIFLARSQLEQDKGNPTSSSAQNLPKLGIPRDILANMSPAQLQMFMLQYRTGAFPNVTKGQALLTVSTTSNKIPISAALTPFGSKDALHRLAGAAASMSPLNAPAKTTSTLHTSIPNAAVLINSPLSRSTTGTPATVRSTLVTEAAKNIQVRSVNLSPADRIKLPSFINSTANRLKPPSVVGNIALLRNSTSSGVLNKKGTSGALLKTGILANSPLLQKVEIKSAPSAPINVSTPYIPTTMLPPGVTWDAIKNSLKAQVKERPQLPSNVNATLPSSINKSQGIISMSPAGNATLLQVTPKQINGVQTLRPASTVTSNKIGNLLLMTPTTVIKALSSTSNPDTSTQALSGRLLIQGKAGVGQTTIQSKLTVSNTINTVKKVGVPMGASNVRFISPPDTSKIRFINQVDASNVRFVNQSDGHIKKIVMLPSKTGSPKNVTRTPITKVHHVASSSFGLPHASTTLSISSILPVQGIRGCVVAQPSRVKYSGQVLSSVQKQQNIVPMILTQQGLSIGKTELPMGSQTDRLHGLKKAVQQVAAVNEISSKLQNQLKSSSVTTTTILSLTSTVQASAAIVNPAGGILSINSVGTISTVNTENATNFSATTGQVSVATSTSRKTNNKQNLTAKPKSILESGSIITPEKLRDAEALLALIDPNRLGERVKINSNGNVSSEVVTESNNVAQNINHTTLSVSQTTRITNTVAKSSIITIPTSHLKLNSNFNTIKNLSNGALAIKTSVNTGTLPNLTMMPTNLSIPVTNIVSAGKIPGQLSTNIINNGVSKGMLDSAGATLKSPIKIQLPGSPVVPFRTFPSNVFSTQNPVTTTSPSTPVLLSKIHSVVAQPRSSVSSVDVPQSNQQKITPLGMTQTILPTKVIENVQSNDPKLAESITNSIVISTTATSKTVLHTHNADAAGLAIGNIGQVKTLSNTNNFNAQSKMNQNSLTTSTGNTANSTHTELKTQLDTKATPTKPNESVSREMSKESNIQSATAIENISKTHSISTNAQINGHGTTAQKMVLDQTIVQKLQSEGRIVMSPTGQMFLLTGNIPGSKVS